jgi:hypothetical protein
MWVLKCGKKPLEWLKIESKGVIPEPRHSHTVTYYEKGNYLIIHGGRNDLSNDSFALNDTWLFELNRWEWLQVHHYSKIPNFSIYNRCGHASIVYGTY